MSKTSSTPKHVSRTSCKRFQLKAVSVKSGNFKKTLAQKVLLTAFLVTTILIPAYSQDQATGKATQSVDTVQQKVKKEARNENPRISAKPLHEDELIQVARKKLNHAKRKRASNEKEMGLQMVFKVLGGLGIFLLGMKFMSESIQTIADGTLKKLVKAMTNNRFMACGAGIIITMLIQSSSVTTIMAVGFVNSTIMSLNQAIGVILGANIGTTITGWILVLKVNQYGLPVIGVATFIYLFAKKEMSKHIAFAIVGVGMIFFGLELMKNGFKPIQELNGFIEWFRKFDAHTYTGVIKCALVGCVLTAIVQSSSATLGITLALTTVGIIEFRTAAALVLGENIGTTITAYLASLNASVNAKRAAYFHMVFNTIGVTWIIAIFPYYINFIEYIMLHFNQVADISVVSYDKDGYMVRPESKTAIAYVHSIFNITNVLLFLPFTTLTAKWLKKYVPDRKEKASHDKTRLAAHLLQSPFMALEQSAFEVKKMRDKSREMFLDLARFLEQPQKNNPQIKKTFASEKVLGEQQHDITAFLTEVLSGPLSLEQTEEVKKQLFAADEFRSMSSYIRQILEFYLKLNEFNFTFNQEQKSELKKLHRSVVGLFDKVNADDGKKHDYQTVISQNKELSSLLKILRHKHWDKVSRAKMPLLLSTTYIDVLSTYQKINNILLTIYESQHKTNS